MNHSAKLGGVQVAQLIISFLLVVMGSGLSPALANHDGVTLSTPSAECGVCHQKQFNEWRYGADGDLDSMGRGSYHALAYEDEVYGILRDLFDAETQVYCDGCHVPGNPWAVQDKINGVPVPRTVNMDEGVNCVVCHFDGSRLVTNAELNDPVFCATCHNDGYPLTEAYDGWAYDYQGNKDCVDCHMQTGGQGHLFGGSHSPFIENKTLLVSKPSLPGTVLAGQPFDITVTVTNNGAGHSFPVCPLRKLRVRISVANAAHDVVSYYEESFYKRSSLFGEDETLTNVMKAGDSLSFTVPQNIEEPGVYTARVEVFRDRNRFGILNSTVLPWGEYVTFVVE